MLKDKAFKRTMLQGKKGQGRIGQREARQEKEYKKEIVEETNE